MLSQMMNNRETVVRGHRMRKVYKDNFINDSKKLQKNMVDAKLMDMVEYKINDSGHQYGYINNTAVCVNLGVTIAETTLMVKEGEIIPLILTDKIFNMLSRNGRRFVLLHEVGHYENGDLKLSLFNIGRQYRKEIAADMYAAKRMGKELALNAISELISILKIFAPYASEYTQVITELNRRYSDISRKCR